MALDLKDLLRPRADEGNAAVPFHAPLSGTRTQRVQRLQIGLIGIGAMLLLVGLADAISSRAQLTEDDAVPEAAPTVEASEEASPRDPLIEAGVVPDHPEAEEADTDSVPDARGTANRNAPSAGNAPLQ